MKRLLHFGLFMLTTGPVALAQFGKPMEVRYQLLPRTDKAESPWLGEVQWKAEGQVWRVVLQWTKGWPIAGRQETFDESEGHYALQGVWVHAPDGRRQMAFLDAEGKYGLGRELNGAFADPMDWRLPWWPWEFSGSLRGAFGHKLLRRVPEVAWKPEYGCRWIYPGEQAVVGSWRIMRILWHVGGMSGPPPMPYVLVVEHQPSGAWCALGHVVGYPDTPDRGDVMRVEGGPDDTLLVRQWGLESRNVGALSGWRFAFQDGQVRRQALSSRYALYTRNGAVATFADTPKEAIHFGYQEVAWHLQSWNAQGGTARAFAPSPRRYLTPTDREGAPQLPVPGERRFQWAGELYVVPRIGKPSRRKLSEVLLMLRSGRWDVVLFRRPDGTMLGQRLVEHSRDLPHSTPSQAADR